jgi:carboxymethylenebutenolidase
MKARALGVVIAIGIVVAGGGLVLGERGTPVGATAMDPARTTMPASAIARAGLPSEQSARAVLSAALMHRHPQYLDIAAGATPIRSFVVFPERADRAPVLVMTSNTQGMSDWLRAVGDAAAAEGFIAVVPDLLTGMGLNGGGTHAFSSAAAVAQALEASRSEVERRAAAVTREAIRMPAGNGNGASVRFHFANGGGRIDVAIESPMRRTASFELADHAWHQALALLMQLDPLNSQLPVPNSQTPSQQAGRGAQGRGAAPPEGGGLGGMRSKRPDLPANFLMAAKTAAQSPRKGEWVDIPMQGGTKLHTWISYPQNVAKAPVVLVFQPGPGMDMGEPITRGGGANWLRAIADQLALEGFIGVLPDLTSGLGPNGGNFDSFQFPDESGAALNRIPHADVIKRIQVAADYALALPMANGRLGATGFCMGGGLAWEVAAEVPQVNASVAFYGGPPPEAVMARIHAPVAAFFGENDLGLAPRIAPATADMKRLGKSFMVEVYKEATHLFLYRQDLGRNMAATEDAWPKAIAFFKTHLMMPAPASR